MYLDENYVFPDVVISIPAVVMQAYFSAFSRCGYKLSVIS